MKKLFKELAPKRCEKCANARPYTEAHTTKNGAILYGCVYQKYLFFGTDKACADHFEPKAKSDES